MALAMRWVLDQPGVAVTLWGPRRPQDLDPLTNVLGWKLDREALTQIDELLARSVTAPPEHRQEA